MDLEEGLQETNATFNEPKTIWDQDKEHINEPGSDGANYFPLVTAMVNDQAGPDTLVMFTSKFRFLWPYSVNHKYCCIYRVPCRLRNVRPDAYTPQMLFIGPLSKKPQIMELSKNDSRYTTQTQLAYMCITFSFSTLFFLVYVKIVRRSKMDFVFRFGLWITIIVYNICYIL